MDADSYSSTICGSALLPRCALPGIHRCTRTSYGLEIRQNRVGTVPGWESAN